MQLLLKVLIITVMPVVEGHVGKDIQSACAIIQGQVVVGAPLVVFPRIAGHHQTQSVALCLHCLDTDDSIHLSIVLGTRSSDDINTLDINRFQLLQFALIAYFFIVDIDLWFAFGQHFKLTIFALHHRHHR